MVDAPVDRVFGFHERADAFTLLTPAFPPVRVVGKVGENVVNIIYGYIKGKIPVIDNHAFPWTIPSHCGIVCRAFAS